MGLMLGEYRERGLTLTTDGQYGRLQLDRYGNLKTSGSGANFRETPIFAAGASSVYGKIDTVPAGGTIIVSIDCSEFPVTKVDWDISCDKSWSYQLGRCNSNPQSATITLNDNAPVDDGDTFILNGLTFTAESTEGDALASERKYYIPSQEQAAINLAALLSHETYGVPGITASAAAVGSTDVVTITGVDATCLQFAQGTSDSGEIAFANLTRANINMQSALITGKAATTGWAAETIADHYIDGWGWACILLTNNDGAAAATFAVRGARY